jgi:hypothetical protein
MNYIANGIRDNLFSHIKPSFDVVRGLTVAAVSSSILLSGCATSKGNERHAQHAADQIRMVAVQREARVQEAEAEAESNTALVQALADVARNSPESANAVAVALAVIGVRGEAVADDDAPVVTLQRQQNEALEWTKALAPTVGGLVTGLGVAAINAEVQKNASDNNREILLGDQAADRGIVEAVAGLGQAAATAVGVEVGGDYYQMEDSASVDNSVTTSTSQDTTTTTTTSTTVSLNTALNYDGADMTLKELISELNSAGAAYSIDIDGDGTPDVSGGTDTESTQEVKINCNLTFGPRPPQCLGG